MSQKTCEECGALRDFAVCEGFEVCTSCGEADQSFIDVKHHWSVDSKAFSPDQTLATYISKSSNAQNRRLQRVQQWNAVTPKEREMRHTVTEFASIQASLSLSSHIVDLAVKLYGDFLTHLADTLLHRCKRRTCLRAASVFFACKELGVPRERKEIASKLKLPLKNVTKCCNLFFDVMGQVFREKPPLTAADFVERYCALLGVTDRQMVHEMIDATARLNLLNDKTPTSVASTCILFLVNHKGLPITKADVQQKCGNSNAIITRSLATLAKNKEELLANIKDHGGTGW